MSNVLGKQKVSKKITTHTRKINHCQEKKHSTESDSKMVWMLELLDGLENNYDEYVKGSSGESGQHA